MSMLQLQCVLCKYAYCRCTGSYRCSQCFSTRFDLKIHTSNNYSMFANHLCVWCRLVRWLLPFCFFPLYAFSMLPTIFFFVPIDTIRDPDLNVFGRKILNRFSAAHTNENAFCNSMKIPLCVCAKALNAHISEWSCHSCTVKPDVRMPKKHITKQQLLHNFFASAFLFTVDLTV